jgi:hypothetical protein
MTWHRVRRQMQMGLAGLGLCLYAPKHQSQLVAGLTARRVVPHHFNHVFRHFLSRLFFVELIPVDMESVNLKGGIVGV